MKSKKLFTINKEVLRAHGGGILFDSGYYYFYGEDRIDDNYVSIYRNKDLKNWEFRKHILTINSKDEELGLMNMIGESNIENKLVCIPEYKETAYYVLQVENDFGNFGEEYYITIGL